MAAALRDALARRFHAVLRQISKLDALVGQHGVDFVGYGFDKGFKEVRSRLPFGPLVQFCVGELRSPADGHEQLKLAFLGADFVDVEVADSLGLELLLAGFVALGLWQPADAMTRKAAMKGRAREVASKRPKRLRTRFTSVHG